MNGNAEGEKAKQKNDGMNGVKWQLERRNLQVVIMVRVAWRGYDLRHGQEARRGHDGSLV